MPRRLLTLVLALSATASFLVFVLSFGGHPPYSGIGIAILLVSLVPRLALTRFALTVLRSRDTRREE